jgi:glucose-6-phosphate-specific signal transduction histidine kinase
MGKEVGVMIQNARLFEQVVMGRERLQILSQQLIEVQENERRHIARELHDEIGQALTALKVNLQTLGRLQTPGGVGAAYPGKHRHCRQDHPTGTELVSRPAPFVIR